MRRSSSTSGLRREQLEVAIIVASGARLSWALAGQAGARCCACSAGNRRRSAAATVNAERWRLPACALQSCRPSASWRCTQWCCCWSLAAPAWVSAARRHRGACKPPPLLPGLDLTGARAAACHTPNTPTASPYALRRCESHGLAQGLLAVPSVLAALAAAAPAGESCSSSARALPCGLAALHAR